MRARVRARCLRLSAVVASALLGSLTAGAADAPKPMKMDEPMHGEMKKDSMKKGDVKKAAERKEKEMKEKMEQERREMMKSGGKKP